MDTALFFRFAVVTKVQIVVSGLWVQFLCGEVRLRSADMARAVIIAKYGVKYGRKQEKCSFLKNN